MELLKEFEDEVLGTFSLDDNEYTALVEWLGTSIEIGIQAQETDSMQKTLASIYRFIDDSAHWDDYLRRMATDQLLDIKNSEWLQEEEREIEYKEFYERINLQSIFANADGSFDALLDDDDIFHGNLINVHADTKENVKVTITDL